MNAIEIQSLEQDLYSGKRIEKKGYGITVTTGRGTPMNSAAKKMLASVGDLATGEHVFTGSVPEAAKKFASLIA